MCVCVWGGGGGVVDQHFPKCGKTFSGNLAPSAAANRDTPRHCPSLPERGMSSRLSGNSNYVLEVRGKGVGTREVPVSSGHRGPQGETMFLKVEVGCCRLLAATVCGLAGILLSLT